jgi:ABC-type multidrug transport system fused ATPase/permease subunit
MGSLNARSGEIQISGEFPSDAFSKWPGSVGYVPQSIEIMKGSIKSNVALGFDPTEIDDQSVWDSLDLAQLGDFVRSLPEGLITEVGERGTQLSGGQRQRLGIARALLSSPTLLILDEATSALDSETESLLSKALLGLRGQTTVVMIAHRLSSVKSADKVVYMERGKIRAMGTMEDVKKQVPGFEVQAKLIGM